MGQGFATTQHPSLLPPILYVVVVVGIDMYLHILQYSPTYRSRANEFLQQIRGTDYVVFVLINALEDQSVAD